MPGYEDRASILHGLESTIFTLVCERATREQWAEWLRAPLEHAVGTANHDLVKKLLKAGADGNAGWRGCDGRTLLHAGAEGGDADIISALIRAGAGADMKAKAPSTGRTPLHTAAFGGKEATAKALMLAGADANTLDATKDAPLHLAIKGGHVRLAEDMLAAADVNARDACGDAPLHLAIKGGHVRLAENLLLNGADQNVKRSNGDYPIHLAVRRGQHEVVRALAHKGTNLNLRTFSGGRMTPIGIAVIEDRFSTLPPLLAGGADVNLRDDVLGHAALHLVAERNKTWAIPALVEAGANIEARTSAGNTPLSISAHAGSCAVMLALLKLGANIHSKNNNGKTPLHNACKHGKADAADLLLRWGADETIADNGSKTPSQRIPAIDRAKEQDRPGLERLAKLLVHASQDRAWRRRGFVVMCRAHPERLRLVVEILDTEPETVERPQERPGRRVRRAQVKVEIGGAHGGGGAASSSRRAGRRGGGEGAGGGFDGVAAWLMGLEEEELFRKILGFL